MNKNNDDIIQCYYEDDRSNHARKAKRWRYVVVLYSPAQTFRRCIIFLEGFWGMVPLHLLAYTLNKGKKELIKMP